MAKLDAMTLLNGLNTPVATPFRVAQQGALNASLRANVSDLKVSEQPTVSLVFRPENKSLPQKVSIKTAVPPLASELALDPNVDDVAVFVQIVSKENVSVQRVKDALAYTSAFLKTDVVTEAVYSGLAPH